MCIGPVGLAETYSTLTRSPCADVRAAVVARPRRGSSRSSSRQIASAEAHVDEARPGDLGRGRPRAAPPASARSARPARADWSRRPWPAPSPHWSRDRHAQASRGGSTATALRLSPAGSAPSASRSSSMPSSMRGIAGVKGQFGSPRERKSAPLAQDRPRVTVPPAPSAVYRKLLVLAACRCANGGPLRRFV